MFNILDIFNVKGIKIHIYYLIQYTYIKFEWVYCMIFKYYLNNIYLNILNIVLY